MKIPIRDGDAITLGNIPVKIKDLGSGLEKITVRILHLEALEEKRREAKRTAIKKQQIRPQLLSEISRRSEQQTPHPDEATPEKTKAPNSKELTKTVEIKLSLPSLSKVKLPPFVRLKDLAHRLPNISKPTLIKAGVAVAVIITLLGTFHILPGQHKTSSQNGSHAAKDLEHGSPSYATILPAGKTIHDFGGWTRVSPPDRNPVYAYVDKVNGIQIDVSEQPLPEQFQTDTSQQIAQLAQGFNANDKFVASGTIVYVGTSAKGPQSVIFTKNNLLVLIKSATKISDNQWSTYVSTLQ